MMQYSTAAAMPALIAACALKSDTGPSAHKERLIDAARRGFCMAGELRPGDPGLALDAQAAVLRLAQAETIGISLSAGGLMHPVKSCSMVLGIGIDLPPVEWSRCDYCPRREKCSVVERAGAVAHLS